MFQGRDLCRKRTIFGATFVSDLMYIRHSEDIIKLLTISVREISI